MLTHSRGKHVRSVPPGKGQVICNRILFVLTAFALFAANVVFARTPLEVCYDKASGAEDRLAVGPCIDAMLKEADEQMAAALASRKKAAAELARVTERDTVVKSLEAAQKQFLAYRKAQCRYVLDAMQARVPATLNASACCASLDNASPSSRTIPNSCVASEPSARAWHPRNQPGEATPP